MKPETRQILKNSGFSLIEVIVAIVLAAFMGAMIVQFTGTNITSTVKSLVAAQNNTTTVSVMEQITRDYRNWLESSPDGTINDFEADVNSDYPEVQTDIIPPGELRGDDPDNSILEVTVSQGDRKLVSLFTK